MVWRNKWGRGGQTGVLAEESGRAAGTAGESRVAALEMGEVEECELSLLTRAGEMCGQEIKVLLF